MEAAQQHCFRKEDDEENKDKRRNESLGQRRHCLSDRHFYLFGRRNTTGVDEEGVCGGGGGGSYSSRKESCWVICLPYESEKSTDVKLREGGGGGGGGKGKRKSGGDSCTTTTTTTTTTDEVDEMGCCNSNNNYSSGGGGGYGVQCDERGKRECVHKRMRLLSIDEQDVATRATRTRAAMRRRRGGQAPVDAKAARLPSSSSSSSSMLMSVMPMNDDDDERDDEKRRVERHASSTSIAAAAAAAAAAEVAATMPSEAKPYGIAVGTMKRKRTPTRAVQRSLVVKTASTSASGGIASTSICGASPTIATSSGKACDGADTQEPTTLVADEKTPAAVVAAGSASGNVGAAEEEEEDEDEEEDEVGDAQVEGLGNAIQRNGSGTADAANLHRGCCKSLIYFLHKHNSLVAGSGSGTVTNVGTGGNDAGTASGTPVSGTANAQQQSLILPRSLQTCASGRGALATAASASSPHTTVRQMPPAVSGTAASLVLTGDSPLIPSDSPLLLINLVRAHGYHSILLHASREGNTQVVSLLAMAGADFNISDDDGSTPLIFASDAGRVDTARVLLDGRAGVNARDKLGRSALTYAMYRGRVDIVRLLLERGADASLFDVDGCTPLMYGAARGTTECCAALLDMAGHNVSVDGKNKDGFTALVYALECGHVETGRELLRRGARADSRSANGSTCLHWAATCGQVESCRALLELTGIVDANARNARGITPLMYSTARGQALSTRLLLDRGADIHAQDSEGSTPLMYACYRGFSDIAVMLLEAGADFYATNLRGATPLMYASARGKKDTCFTLLRWVEERCGGDEVEMHTARRRLVCARDCKGFTAVDWAMHGGYAQTEALLKVAARNIPVRWTRLTNRLYPDDFKVAVRALLVAMHTQIGMPGDVVDSIIECYAAATIWNSSILPLSSS